MYMLQAYPPYEVTSAGALTSPQWVIDSIDVSTGLAYFLGSPYSCVTYTISATRRSNFYILNVLLPSAV